MAEIVPTAVHKVGIAENLVANWAFQMLWKSLQKGNALSPSFGWTCHYLDTYDERKF